ncbi:MAG: hypothetical protein GX351_04075 [Peptococcaceae bacterium]|nr:hypothetical protein [Peptococcaceae bacterium]
MGTSILKGVTTGLLMTVLTLLVVLGCTVMAVDNKIMSYIVDFGLLLSCLAAGYRASRHSGRILPAGLASGGYAIVGVLLLALYFPIDTLGAIKIISEGTGLGLLAGLLGAGALGSDSAVYERMETYNFPRREHFYERKDIHKIIKGDQEQRQDYRMETRTPVDREQERTKIYELCKQEPEKAEEDEAFAWWRLETKRQLKGR